MELNLPIWVEASEAPPNHRLSAVKLVAKNEELCKPMDSSMVMLGAQKRGDPNPFESPDGKLAAEFAEDAPSTMMKPPP